MDGDTPAQVDVGTEVDESAEFDAAFEGDGPGSVAELTRSILKSDANKLNDESRDLDITKVDSDDPLADDDWDDDEPEEVAETPAETPVITPEVAQKPAVDNDAIWTILESNAGYSLRDKYTTPDEAVKGLANAQRALSQRDELAYWGKQLQENPEGVFDALAKRLGKNPAEQPVVQAPTKEATPAYDPAWNTYIDRDSGEWKANTPPDVISAASKYQQYREKEKVRELIKDDLEAFRREVAERDKRIDELNNKLAQREQHEQQGSAQQQHMYELKSHLNNHAKWIFIDGNPSTNSLTEAGKILEENLKEFSQHIANPAALVKAAVDATVIQVAQKQPPAAGTQIQKDQRTQKANVMESKPAGQKRAASKDPWKGRTPNRNDLAAELAKLLP